MTHFTVWSRELKETGTEHKREYFLIYPKSRCHCDIEERHRTLHILLISCRPTGYNNKRYGDVAQIAGSSQINR